MPRRPTDEDGIALVVVLTATTLLLALCSALVLLTTTETSVAANNHDAAEVFYAADSAVALVVGELRAVDWAEAITGSITSALTDGSPSGRRSLPDGREIDLDVERPSDDAGLPWRSYAYGRLADWLPGAGVEPRIYVVVWLRADAAGDPATLVVRGRAYGPRGARRTVEAVVRRPSASEGRPPASIQSVSWRER